MNRKRALVLLLLPCCTIIGLAQPRAPSEIEKTIRRCVDQQHRAPGIVIGLIDENGTNVFAYGKRERGKLANVDGDTLFEIGSITKVFTTVLLQEMVENGEVKLDDPIEKFVPVSTIGYHGKQITLLDLATHTSGLPSMPDNISPKDGDDPWADYSVQQMYEFLSACKLERKPGVKFEYSNYGMGLLGHILALKAGTNYEALVRSRICEPLGMDSTIVTVSTEMKPRLATGHSSVGPPVKNWGSLALQGDGALYSTVNDLLKFLAVNMGRGTSALSAVMAKTHVPLRSAGLGEKVGLGWMNFSFVGAHYVWHNGGTGGYRSFIGFDRAKRRGAIVLVNEATDVDDVARYLFLPEIYDSIDKFKAPIQRTISKIDYILYNRYVGRYQFSSKHFITITRDGNRLLAQESGRFEFPYEIFPESETEFFYTAGDAQLSFVSNGAGTVTQLILHQDGKNSKATKIE